jgi:3-oxoacyl-[acyl-carrier protein] reductase
MSDSYLNFANSSFGSKLADLLGLPKPMLLDRYQPEQPLLKGSLLLGAGPAPALTEVLARLLVGAGVQTLAHRSLPQWTSIANLHGLTTGRWGIADQPGEKVKALLFDATGMTDSNQSEALYQFFHETARSVLPSGRVVIVGRPPESCDSPRQATVQVCHGRWARNSSVASASIWCIARPGLKASWSRPCASCCRHAPPMSRRR